MLSYNLPNDLMEEIMARLPVKSLLRFKSVAKSWYALISDPSFSTKHLECSNTIAKNLSQKLMFQNFNRISNVPPSIFPLYNREEPRVIQDFEWTFPIENDLILDWIYIYGECNGIFFLCLFLYPNPKISERGAPAESQARLILWNPATKETKLITTTPCQLAIKRAKEAMFGFGFDPITKDYNVVGFPTRLWRGQPLRVEVYHLSTNSWRTMDVDVPIFYPDYTYWCSYWNKSYLNGAHHWLTIQDYNDINNKLIVSFDFSKKAFVFIRPPIIDVYGIENVLTVIDENLAIIATYRSLMLESKEYRAEIWVMNEYGIESSWTKKFKIGPFRNFADILGFWGDREMLVDDQSGKLILYNPRNHQRRKFQIHFHQWGRLRMMDYVESLFPLGRKGKHILI